MKNKSLPPPVKHVPRRTCIACRKVEGKRELVRLVCLPEGNIEVDLTGKKSGRGAYLCPIRACWDNAIVTGRLEYALRKKLNPENKERLVNFARGFDNIDSRTGRS